MKSCHVSRCPHVGHARHWTLWRTSRRVPRLCCLLLRVTSRIGERTYCGDVAGASGKAVGNRACRTRVDARDVLLEVVFRGLGVLCVCVSQQALRVGKDLSCRAAGEVRRVR